MHEVGKDFVEGVVNTGKAIWGGITDLFNNGSPPAEVANAQLPSEEQDAERQYLEKEQEWEQVMVQICQKQHEKAIENLLLDQLRNMETAVKENPSHYQEQGIVVNDAYIENLKATITSDYTAQNGNCEDAANVESPAPVDPHLDAAVPGAPVPARDYATSAPPAAAVSAHCRLRHR